MLTLPKKSTQTNQKARYTNSIYFTFRIKRRPKSGEPYSYNFFYFPAQKPCMHFLFSNSLQKHHFKLFKSFKWTNKIGSINSSHSFSFFLMTCQLSLGKPLNVSTRYCGQKLFHGLSSFFTLSILVN